MLAATTLLSNQASADEIAARAEQLFDQLLHHFARLVGRVATLALFKRAVWRTGARLTWIAVAAAREPSSPALVAVLRAAMARESPSAIIDAFAGVLIDFTGLLRTLIGEPLVRQLLVELWPIAFRTEKESP